MPLQAAAAAAAPLPEEQLAAARQRAATATTTLPPDARLYTALPPPPQPAATCQVSPRKAAALAGARKQLDPRWEAERRELQPELGQLWVAAERLPGQPAPAALPAPLPAPLPDPQRLAAACLGLRL